MPGFSGMDEILSLWGLAWHQCPLGQTWSTGAEIVLEPKSMVVAWSLGPEAGLALGVDLEPVAAEAGLVPGFTGAA